MTPLIPLGIAGILIGVDLAWGERWSARALVPLGRLIGLAPAARPLRATRSYGWRIAGTMLAAFSAFLIAFTLIIRLSTQG